MGKVLEHRNICGHNRLPGMMCSPYCEREADHKPPDQHYGGRQHWSVTPEQMTLREQELFKASLDRILDWPFASHVDVVVADDEVMVTMSPRLYDGLMGIESHRPDEQAVLLSVRDFQALTTKASKRLKSTRIEVHQHVRREPKPAEPISA